jgi:hypothetical protein
MGSARKEGGRIAYQNLEIVNERTFDFGCCGRGTEHWPHLPTPRLNAASSEGKTNCSGLSLAFSHEVH